MSQDAMTPAAPPALQVGSTVWIFDHNRRVYPPAPKGKLWTNAGPIYREHWVERKITGENRTSWLIGERESFAKKRLDGARLATYPKGGHGGNRVAISIREVDDDCWANDRRYDVVRAVDRCDVATLRKIAELLGMEEK